MTSSVVNHQLVKSSGTVIGLKENDHYSKVIDRVASALSIDQVCLALSVFCWISLGYLWVFNKAQRGGRFSKVLF